MTDEPRPEPEPRRPRPDRRSEERRPRRAAGEGAPVRGRDGVQGRREARGRPGAEGASFRGREGGQGRREVRGRPASERAAGGARYGDRGPRRDDRPPVRRAEDERPQRRVDEPVLPDGVAPGDLERGARAELRTLSKENAEVVAKHLVMAGRLIEDDPRLAHRHALAAAGRAGRVAVVRETLAITAYATGDFALALRELRTYRRLSGSDDQIALMVDSERGIGRPDRALELGRSVDRSTLPIEAQVGLAIAMSGARLDRGEPRDALAELERAPLDLKRVSPWSPGLYGAFATVYEDLGDADEALRWSGRADRAAALLEAVDEESSTVTITEDDPE